MAEHRTTATCYACGKEFAAIEWRDEDGRTTDTAGGMRFDNGWECDGCLGGDAALQSEYARSVHR